MNFDEYKTPGQLLKDLLKDKSWTQQILATVLEIDRTYISKIIRGVKSVDADTALLFEEVFNVDAQIFINLQSSYDLAQAKIKFRENPTRATRAKMLSELPVPEMIKRGWINPSDISDMESVENQLSLFFNVEDMSQVVSIDHAAKKSNPNEKTSVLQEAWLTRVAKLASEILTPKYKDSNISPLITELKKLRFSVEEIRKVPKLVAQAGVKMLIVEALPTSKIDGACFWLNDDEPVIVLSLRFDRIDNFWFVLIHELEHVKNGDGKINPMLDVDMDQQGSNINLQEKIANEAAAEFCVNQKIMGKFIKSKDPIYSRRDVLALAKIQNTHAGLIVGQIHKKTGNYQLLREYLVSVKKHLLPYVTSDGWGDIAPLD